MTSKPLTSSLVAAAQAWQDTKSDDDRRQLIAAANKVVEHLETPAETLARIGWGEPSRTAALQTAFELGLLEKLSDLPQTSQTLAEGTPADPALVGRILKHLTACSLVNETGADLYVATDLTRSLDDPTLRGGYIYSFDGMIPTFHRLPSFLAKINYQVPTDNANGPVRHALQTDKPFFAILQENARLGSAFNDFMTERLLTGGESRMPLLVDVGGGLGSDLSRFRATFPDAGCALILQDTSSVIAQAKASTPALPSAIMAMTHDFFTPQPESARSARAYYLHLVLHDWDDENCRKILGNVRDAMESGYSKLLINENVMEDVGAPWQQTSLDWTMMAMLVNRERTKSQWTALLDSVGLRIEGIWSKDLTSESVIEAVLA